MIPAVEMKNVSFAYLNAEEKVIENSNFTVNYGEITLLAAPSGQGKSTILSLISGIIPNVIQGEVQGEILIDGESIKEKRLSEVCRNVGVVLQNADSQIIQQTVEDEIAFGCENFNFEHDKIKRQIEFACKNMSLDPSWFTRTLSGGQKQRLITASTLATEQKIIILDEPLANLDIKCSVMLMKALKSLAMNGYAIIIIEHRIDMVIKYVDRVWTIQNHQTVEVKSRENFLHSQAEIIEDSHLLKPDNAVAFKLNHLSYKAGGREILKDIDFDVKKGERVLLLGENGCGKTTVLRLIAKLYKPTGGNIEQKILPALKKNKTSKEWFKKVGVVYQNPNYQLFMPTVKAEIEYNAFSDEYADKIIKLFNFEKLVERHPQSLSEGQKRRLSIAAVLASKPDVLLLDEPTVGQDYKGLKNMVDILNDIHTNFKTTIITVTHDLRCAEALCDRAFIIENGKVISSGGKETAHNFLFKNLQEALQ